jgi:hypothetical protein
VTNHQHTLKGLVRLVLDGTSGLIHDIDTDTLRPDVTGLLGQAGTGWAQGPILSHTYGGRILARNPNFWSPYEIDYWTNSAGKNLELVDEEEVRFSNETLRDARNATTALRAGVNVSCGATDEDSWEGFRFHTYIWAAVAGGMTPAEALRCVSLNSAHELGMDADLGSIENGKIADLVVLNSNPLVEIRSTTDIKYVIKDGIVRDAQTLDEVWPGKKIFPRFPWQAAPSEASTATPVTSEVASSATARSVQ